MSAGQRLDLKVREGCRRFRRSGDSESSFFPAGDVRFFPVPGKCAVQCDVVASHEGLAVYFRLIREVRAFLIVQSSD
jgi:hypothetical protein